MTTLLRWLYLQLTERLYGEWSPVYEVVAWLVSLGHWHEWRRSALSYVSGPRILELGPGAGRLLPHLADVGGSVVAAEPSPQMAVRSAGHAKRAGKDALIVRAVAQEMPIKAACVDTVVCTFPAGYILDRRTIVECKRILGDPARQRTTSRLVITGLWVETDVRLLSLFGLFYGRPSMQFLAEYAALIRKQGFSVAYSEQQHGPFRVGSVIAAPNNDNQTAID